MENDNSEIAIILSHANDPKRKKLLEECLQSIEIEKLVSCNFPLDVNAQKLTDWMLYNSENDLLTENQYSEFGVTYYHWIQKEDGSIVTTNQTYEHGYAVYNLIKNALLFCKRLGKDIVHIINYDYIIPTKIINEHSDCFTNNNTLNLLVYQDDVELTGYSTGFLSGKIDYLLLFFEHYKSKFEYYRDFDDNVPRSFYLEGKILKFYSSKNQSEIKLNHFDTIKHLIQINRESLVNMEMKHFYQNIGEDWFNYQELYSEMVRQFPDGSKFVEVGSWKGRSAAFMAVEIINSGKKIKFDCVDNWEYVDGLQYDIDKSLFGKDIYNEFIDNIKPVSHIINPIKSISWEGASLYDDKSLDFIFIDAAHDYESVKKDLIAWIPKLKPNGVIAGHDYTSHIGVKTAVDELLSVEILGSCWIYRNNRKKFSIIVPTYKRTEILNRALNSIKNQTYKDYEVIVCSDGYSREDEMCVDNFKDDRFTYRYINKSDQKNWGHMQRNEMIKFCKGDYTIWLDDDNIIYPDYLEYANNIIDRDYGMLIFKINHNYVGLIPKDIGVVLGEIDTLNVMIKTDIAKSFKWLMQYDADYYFIKECERYCLQTGIPIRYLDKIIGNHN